MAVAARLLRVPLDGAAAGRSAPADVLRVLADEPWPFALTGDWAGGGSVVGASPLRVASPEEDPFALLDELPAVDSGAHGAVGGGWFGWLGYGLGARVEQLPPGPPRPAPLPPFQLAYYDHVLRRDAAGRWWFEALVTPERATALDARLAELRERLAEAAALAPADPPPPGPFGLTGAGAAGHLAAVRECRERIAAGEIFQANVCLRLEAAWGADGAALADVGDAPASANVDPADRAATPTDLAALFARASARVEPAYGAAFLAPWGGIASLSPELFLRRAGREVTTAPIKGTVARSGGDAAQADAARALLVDSAKDHAEHVMIVDLMRNDLGRVCEYGSIVAAPTPEAEPHPGLWHLVSRVRGRLRADAGDGALVRATFPPGSVTGAPKVQAMHVIAELEATGREAYTGAIGFASPLAGLELSVAIRTFEARDGRLWLGAGGGIVADSDPARELEECLVKARPLVAAIGGRIEEPGAVTDAPANGHAPAGSDAVALPRQAPATAGGRTAAPTPPTRPALSRDRHRPDPAAGVFETLLVRDREAVRAAEHLARIATSVATLYDTELPADLPARVEALAAETSGRAALRIVAIPQPSGELAVTLETATPRRRELPIVLAPVVLAGGLGACKWRDRRLLDALTGGTTTGGADAPTPLLLDADGSVLEAAWGNVFVLEGERLLTPPADGRLLPGVTRATLIQAAADIGLETLESDLTLARVASADAILVTSALAGALPGQLVAGAPALPGAFALAQRVAHALSATNAGARA